MLNRGIEREVLATCQRYGMGVSAWSPLAKGMLTGKYSKGQEQPKTLRAKHFPKMMSDKRSLDIVEQLITLAQSAGLPLTHMALAFAIAHPALAGVYWECDKDTCN
jgi:aryl-alcohol dehydrogenase (NADP+)